MVRPGGPGTEPPPPPPMGGYNGKILRVNLSKKSVTDEPLSYEICRRYIGGAGFVAYFLWKELKQGVDALSPDNKLIFALGPVTGLLLPGAARYCVGAKSPLTGGIAKSESGGYWMAELKRAGYDAIIIEGKAEKPVYLWIQDGKANIKDASHLWGKETKETQEAIRTELGDEKIQSILIGPAGENLVRYACIMTGLHDAAGRGGLGAVMGSKNLKAIAVRGHRLPKVNNSGRVKEIRQQMLANPSRMSEMGTGGPEMMMMEQFGALPVRNHRDGLFPEVNQIHGGVIKETVRIGMEGCFACPVRCKKVVQFEEPYSVDAVYGGPEYEALGALGSNCGVSNLKAICKGNERCNAYSLDVISTGVVIAFAMECFEKGLLTTKDTDGIELRFGDAEAMLEVIELIARRQGFGNLLAEGTARIAKKIGQDSEKFAMNVKGLESAMPDPRTELNMGIGYMVNSHGADHCSSGWIGGIRGLDQFGMIEPVPDDTSLKRLSLFKLTHCLLMLRDIMVMCSFAIPDYDTIIDLMRAVTGWNTGWVELLKVSERILTVMRLFNIREGFTAADDTLPERFVNQKTDGVLATQEVPDREKMEQAKSYYYTAMGWDANGVPLPEKLEELYIV